jgi:hypothetical protein
MDLLVIEKITRDENSGKQIVSRETFVADHEIRGRIYNFRCRFPGSPFRLAANQNF